MKKFLLPENISGQKNHKVSASDLPKHIFKEALIIRNYFFKQGLESIKKDWYLVHKLMDFTHINDCIFHTNKDFIYAPYIEEINGRRRVHISYPIDKLGRTASQEYQHEQEVLFMTKRVFNKKLMYFLGNTVIYENDLEQLLIKNINRPDTQIDPIFITASLLAANFAKLLDVSILKKSTANQQAWLASELAILGPQDKKKNIYHYIAQDFTKPSFPLYESKLLRSATKTLKKYVSSRITKLDIHPMDSIKFNRANSFVLSTADKKALKPIAIKVSAKHFFDSSHILHAEISDMEPYFHEKNHSEDEFIKLLSAGTKEGNA